MSKYDFGVDLNNASSMGKILNKIEVNSTVLEFGCATGRMTRYMKEALNCEVYIVEYEQSAYDVAIQYAKDGVCGDILDFAWLDKFKDVKFDVIMFADVLEHLIRPEEALMKAKNLLKEDGNIYLSIPNITHNDILLKEINNHFDYTKVGLLDDTHIHFWGLENIYTFAEECGLKIGKIEATYYPLGTTEQYGGVLPEKDVIFLNYFNERNCGEIYQFIVTLNKYSDKPEVLLKCPSIKSHIYVDMGDGFKEESVIEFESKFLESGLYHAYYVIDNCSGINQIRFDPVENQGCILKNISVCQGDRKLELTYAEHLELENGILLNSTDPMVFVNIEHCDEPIVIEADILLANSEYLNEVQSACSKKYFEFGELRRNLTSENESLRGEILSLNEEKGRLNGEVERLNGANGALSEEVERLNEANGALSEEVERLNGANGALSEEVEWLNGANGALSEEVEWLNGANERLNVEIARISAAKDGLQGELNLCLELINKKELYLIEEEQKIEHYEGFASVRLKNKMSKILCRVKDIIIRLLRK